MRSVAEREAGILEAVEVEPMLGAVDLQGGHTLHIGIRQELAGEIGVAAAQLEHLRLLQRHEGAEELDLVLDDIFRDGHTGV